MIKPVDIPHKLSAARLAAKWHEYDPRAFVFEAQNEPLHQGNAAVLTNGAEAWPDSLAITPVLERVAPKLLALIADNVFWCSSGGVNGNHGAQKPADVGTAVRSTCQTWLGRFAVTMRVDGAAPSGRGGGVSFKIRPTVVTPRCSPARHNVSAILTFPMLGFRVFRRCKM